MASEHRVGLLYQRLAKVWRITELRLAFRKFVAEADDGDVSHVDIDAFRRERSEGDITLMVPASRGRLQPVSEDWRQQETTRSKKERLKREAILKLQSDEVGAGKTLKQATEAIANLCRAEGWKMPSERTIRSWRALARQHESQVSPKWPRCGNHRQGPDELLLQAMEGVFAATLAVSDRFTIAAAWKLVEAKYDDLCQKRGQPLGRHGIRKLKTYLRHMHWKDLMLAQLDGRTARALTRTAIGLNTADLYWDVVEMDACFLNIIVRNEDGEQIGRPILYLAVDVATGYVVGFHLTILKPSVLPFVDCLRFMYFAKPDGFDEKYGIRHRVEAFGKPVLLKVDNGSEFIGETAIAVVRELHGDSARCKPMTPQEKPHVERMNGRIKQFVRTLPGSTKSAVSDEPRVLPADEMLLTVEELRGRLLRHIYDDVVLQPNELRSWKNRKAVSPLDIWQDMRSVHLEPLPVSRQEFEMTLYYKRDTRMLRHDGIAVDEFKYHSKELRALFDATGPAMYEIRYADHDAEAILVLPHGGGDPMTAIVKELQGLRVDRATAKEMRAYLKAAGKELTRRTYAQRLAELTEHEQDAKSMGGKNKQARTKEQMKHAREATRPTMPGPAPTPNAGLPGPKSPDGWDFDAGSELGRTRGGQ
jgi:transposase InsO family protein